MGRSNATLSGRIASRSKPVLRRALALGVAAGALLLGVRGTQDAIANGDTRTITIRHMHTKEETTVTFKRDGRYVSEGLEKLNWALRDWRTDEPIRMDPRLFDVAWEVQRTVGSEQPFHVVSAYRSPGTNSMLRRRSRAVAKHSQHMLGKAMDFYLPDTPTARIREAGMRLQRGGVGFYPGAHNPFVHLDAGSVRSWPRMTRDQLVRLFPDEKTVHLPADGQPLGGYELAKAEILSGGGAVAGYAAADLDEGAVISSGRKSLWAALFGGDEEEADARPTRGRRAAPKPQPTVMAYASSGYSDGNASDGGRFAVASVATAPASRSLAQERSERLAPRAPEPPAAQAVAPINAAAAPPPPPQENRPSLVDAPLPLARPRGLTLPQQQGDDGAAVQLAALPATGGALAFAPASGPGAEQKLILAALPPRRPGEIAPLAETIVAGTPTQAPLPPTRPVTLANFALAGQSTPLGQLAPTGLRGSEAVALPEGRLVTVTHPLPPSRPGSGGVTVAASAPARAAPTPIVAQYDADRSGLDSLFAAVARMPAPAGRSVTVATARARTTTPASAPIAGPSPAAALGFSHAEPSDARTGSFSGPAVRALPTNFVQN
ncbi:DUF882 domain-containing protein [Bosea sp. 124]|uniref:DUF882 domain-containing protein n=1 Tax=Bosea sp. 124 TaxID=2135642 RepID=UPI000D45C3FF|nr:DUF882 domain-containing protein [Bosea sp. 124]PTM40752.1 uncharacterized protein YcbK (DUF882 family) [Bosea sp. 124]